MPYAGEVLWRSLGLEVGLVNGLVPATGFGLATDPLDVLGLAGALDLKWEVLCGCEGRAGGVVSLRLAGGLLDRLVLNGGHSSEQ